MSCKCKWILNTHTHTHTHTHTRMHARAHARTGTHTQKNPITHSFYIVHVQSGHYAEIICNKDRTAAKIRSSVRVCFCGEERGYPPPSRRTDLLTNIVEASLGHLMGVMCSGVRPVSKRIDTGIDNGEVRTLGLLHVNSQLAVGESPRGRGFRASCL